jgi:cytochrome bd ubiquinol oxidase subunit II
MDLPLCSALFAAFSIAMYVLLDGFDLGVGALMLFENDELSRDHMIDSITPTWDGNETWLIMTGLVLLAGFPMAYSILMPAFYIPIIVMLLSLGFRGVSFEFRPQMKRYRRSWDILFSTGSITAAAMQGLILGGLIQGVTIREDAFSGSVFDCFRPFPLLCAFAVVAGYMVLGGGWLYLKTSGVTREFVTRSLHRLVPLLMLVLLLVCVAAAFVQPAVLVAGQNHIVALSVDVALMILAGLVLYASIGTTADLRPLMAGLALVLLGLIGFGILVFPDIIPFRLSLWQASAARLSHVFLLTGALVVTPLVLAYSAFAYWVFRGKTPLKGWEA